MFASLKLLLVYVLLGVPTGLVGIPWTLLRGDISWMYRMGMRICALGLRAAGIHVVVSGLENIPAGRSCIFMANHVSNLDPPVLLPVVPGQTSVLLKRELMNIPVLGTAMRLGKYVPVARGSRKDEAQASVLAAASALAAGLHMVVFPEGTRAVDGRLAAFKKGPFFLAMQTGAPIVPVAISGTERMMGKGTWRIVPGEARVQMLPVVEPGEYRSREELLRAVRDAIAGALPEEMRPM